MLHYLRSSVNIKADKEGSKSIVQRVHSELSNVLTGIGHFVDTFKLGVKEFSQPCQTPFRSVADVLQKALKQELGRL